MSRLAIRPARDADGTAIAGLLAQLGYPAEPQALGARLAALEAGGAAAFVAEADGVVAGLVTVTVLPVLHQDAPVGMLTALVVSDSARQRGVGRALVDRAEAFARERGCGRMIVTTAEPREDAHAFYERMRVRATGGWGCGRRADGGGIRWPEGCAPAGVKSGVDGGTDAGFA